MMNNNTIMLKQESFIKYQKELNKLVNFSVKESDLLPISKTNNFPKNKRDVCKKISIEFNAKEKLRNYFNKLSQVKDGSCLLFTEYSKQFGALKINSLKDFNLDFEFTDEHSGIVVITIEDNSNELILDFYEVAGRGQMLDIEAYGNEWSSIDMNNFQ